MQKLEFFEKTLPFITKASRYLGNEINAVKKNLSKIDLKFALAFPDVYEVGMSHLGLQILYHILNSQDRIACERAFAPWPDMEKVMSENGLPLSTLESHIPLKDCNIIGFSLEYELSYATMLKMLSLSGIPLLSSQRDESYPIIIAGGPSAFNPEPVSAFFDAFVIGDGEKVILEICEAFLAWQKNKAPKKELLDMFSEIEGIYVPSFFDVSYNQDGTIKEIIPLKKGYKRINKRIVVNFNDAPFCTSPVVPYMQVIHDRAGIEIARGCSRGCRFCMAGMIYRPVREKSISKIHYLAESTLLNTGYEELSLVSLSSGDFSGICEITKLLIENHRHNKVAVSLPSLRVETLTSNLIEEIKQVRKTGFTIAPEAGTQRLRNVINKGLTEDEIINTVSHIFSAGWNLIKLYFMIGLPTETKEDLEGILSLSNKIASLDRRKQLNVSVSTLVPKPHTPFQRQLQEPAETIVPKQRFLRNNLKGRIRFKWQDHNISILEGVFSRGDRRLADVLIKAHKFGAGLEAWTEHFKPELWDRAFSECRIDKRFYLRQRSVDECLPWSHISCGINDDFLQREMRKALSAEITPDCRTATCAGCGICNENDKKIGKKSNHRPSEPRSASPAVSSAQSPSESSSFRYRLKFSKTGPARFLSHLELSSCFARAMRRAQMPLKYSNGFHPLPRIIFSSALPVGIESLAELMDVTLTQRLNVDEIARKINHHLPEGIRVLSAQEKSLKNSPLIVISKKYRISFPENSTLDFPTYEEIENLLNTFITQKEYIIQCSKNNKTFQADLKETVQNVFLHKNSTIELDLKLKNTITPKLTEIAGNILQLGEKEKKALKIVKLSDKIIHEDNKIS